MKLQVVCGDGWWRIQSLVGVDNETAADVGSNLVRYFLG